MKLYHNGNTNGRGEQDKNEQWEQTDQLSSWTEPFKKILAHLRLHADVDMRIGTVFVGTFTTKNSSDQAGCYPQRPKAEVDNTFRDLQNSAYPTKAEFNNCFIQNLFKIYSKY